MKKIMERPMRPARTSFAKFIAMSAMLLIAAAAVFNQTASSTEDFPMPASMRVEGIPTIRKSDVDHLFFDPPETRSNLIWDVDQKNRRLLVTDEKRNVYQLGSPLARPELLIPKRVPNMVRVDPDGTSFAFNDDSADQDNYELYLWSAGGTIGKLSGFTGRDESVESFVWAKDGKTLYYSQTDYDRKTSKICQHDLAVATCTLTELKGIWNVLDADGDKLLLKYWKASSEQSLHLYDLNTRKLIVVDEQANSEKGFFARGRVFWIAQGSSRCAADPCLLATELKTGSTVPILLPRGFGALHDIKPSPDGRSFLIQEARDGIDNLRVAELRSNSLITRVKPFVRGSYVIWNTRWLSDKEVVYTIENIGKPASIESFKITTGISTAWTKERLPATLDGKARPPEVIRWKSFDRKEITGFAVKPRKVEKRTPVVVFVHGGPQIVATPTFNLRDLRFIANLGITSIHTNIRGSSGFGNDFMDADNGAKRGDAVDDIQSLIDWIGRQPDLDPDRIFLHGESYGGFIVLATALREPERVKAVIAEFPLVSIRGYLGQTWIDEFAKNEYGDPTDESLMQQLDKLSPLNNTSRWNGIPLFLTRGKKDGRVPEKDVLDLKSQLQAKGSDVWFIHDAEAGHGVRGRYVTAAMYEFLKKQIRRK